MSCTLSRRNYLRQKREALRMKLVSSELEKEQRKQIEAELASIDAELNDRR